MKKFLSIILVAIMVVAMLPAGIAFAAGAEQTDLNYVFSHAAHASSVGNGPAGGNVNVTKFDDVGFDDMDYSVSSGAWGNKGHRDGTYDSASSAFGSSCAIHRNGDYWNYVFDKATVNSDDGFYNWSSRINSSAGAPIAIVTIDVPVSGTYIPALNAESNYTIGQVHEIFLVKETEANKGMVAATIRENLKPSERVGAYDASICGEQVFLEHYLEKGVYYLCFVPNGKGAKTSETLTGQTGMRIKSFHLYAPKEKVEAYDPSKLGGDGKLVYNFIPNAINTANKVTDAETGAVTWYFGDSEESVQGYYAAVGNVTQAAVEHKSPLNTWTDQSDTAKAAGKYLPWVATAATSRGDYFWFRTGTKLAYVYLDYAKTIKNNYDYINTANTDKWTYAGYNGSDKDQLYIRSTGLHNQLPKNTLKPLGSGNAYTALKINVPTSAKYDLSVTITGAKKQGAAIYIVPTSKALPTTYAERKDYLITNGKVNSGALTGTFNALKAGDYYFIWEHYDTEDGIDVTTLTDTDLVSLTLTALGEPEAPVEEVAPELAAKRAAMVLDEGNPDAEAVSAGAATINVLARAVDEDDHDIDSVIGTVANVATGAAYTTEEAPEIPGYKFLYWGVGLGTNMRVVSTEETATIKAAKGANYVYAFYSKDNAEDVTVEFYNANRELLKRTSYQAGDKIEIPDLPSLTGVGTAIGWTDDGGETVIGTDAVVEADGPIMAYFAVYDEEAIAENIEITASGSTGITGTGTFAFGDEVTLTAPTRENGTGYNMFLYWKKGDEIVSFDRVYKFNAAVSCTVEAVYAKYGPTSVEALRKIIVSTVGEAVVAEFIGCENALERGFIFGDLRQPMMTDAKSFTMINDTASTARAYAIFADGVIFSK